MIASTESAGGRWTVDVSLGTVDRMRSEARSRTIVALGAVLAVTALAACGGDDASSDDGSTTGDQTEVATGDGSEAPPTAPPSDDDTSDVTGDDGAVGRTATTVVPGGTEIDKVPDDPATQADPTGTISVGGETWDVAGYARALEDGETIELGGDFLICEGDNPAFPGDANIIAVLDDNVQFSFLKSGDTTTAEYGDLFGAEETTAVEFERDGTTISGTAEFPDSGTASFELDCG